MAKEKQPCGCGGENKIAGKKKVTISNVDPLQVNDGCTPIVSSQVCVEADVTITPTVTSGTPIVNCVGTPTTATCRSLGFTPSVDGTCSFTFAQVLCVNVPITFDADVDADKGDVACGLAFTGPDCENAPSTGCTLTRGFFAAPQHQEETLQLLALAGGSITLGNDSLGFSTIVTEDNIFDVLEGNVGPSPQYRQLNAQLLTAKLNVLNGATCAFATNNIALADTFLTSPVLNDALASQIQQLLAQFNEGNAPGCPDHCPEDV